MYPVHESRESVGFICSSSAHYTPHRPTFEREKLHGAKGTLETIFHSLSLPPNAFPSLAGQHTIAGGCRACERKRRKTGKSAPGRASKTAFPPLGRSVVRTARKRRFECARLRIAEKCFSRKAIGRGEGGKRWWMRAWAHEMEKGDG